MKSRMLRTPVPRRLRVSLVAGIALVAAAITGTVFSATSQAALPVGITGYQIVIGPSTPIDDLQTASATISCPVGKTAVSAGVVSHSPLTFISTLAPQNLHTWTVTVTNTATLGYTEHFQLYAVCVDDSSVPGVHIASNTQTVGSPGGNVTDAYCLSTEYAIGGGVSNTSTSSYANILRPTDDNQGWQAFVYNTGSVGGQSFTVYAVCLPHADVTSYNQYTRPYGDYGTLLTEPVNGSPIAKSNTASAPYCAPDQVAVGGGTANHDQTNGFISSTYPSSDNRSWLETSTNINPPIYYDESSLPSVVCVSGTTTPGCTMITGTHGSLTITSGSVCLNNATINGGISVGKGATLFIEHSTVNGSISANAPAGLQICRSTTGSISVSGATGLVRIGDPANNCGANTINGGLTAANNKAGLIIVNNKITGSLTTAGNTGTPITISGNHP